MPKTPPKTDAGAILRNREDALMVELRLRGETLRAIGEKVRPESPLDPSTISRRIAKVLRIEQPDEGKVKRLRRISVARRERRIKRLEGVIMRSTDDLGVIMRAIGLQETVQAGLDRLQGLNRPVEISGPAGKPIAFEDRSPEQTRRSLLAKMDRLDPPELPVTTTAGALDAD